MNSTANSGLNIYYLERGALIFNGKIWPGFGMLAYFCGFALILLLIALLFH